MNQHAQVTRWRDQNSVSSAKCVDTLSNIGLSRFMAFDLFIHVLLLLYIDCISLSCKMNISVPLLSAMDLANSFRSLRTRWRCNWVHLSKRSVKRFIFALRSSNAKLMGAKEAIETGALSVMLAWEFWSQTFTWVQTVCLHSRAESANTQISISTTLSKSFTADLKTRLNQVKSL